MRTSQVSGPRRQVKRHRPRAARRFAGSLVEVLEGRQLLAVVVAGPSAIPAAYWTPTDTNLFDAQNGPMANLGTELVSIYQSYVDGIATASTAVESTPTAAAANVAAGLASQYPTIEFRDGLVGMDIKSLGGDFNQFVATLTGLGMDVTASSSAYGIAEGFVPVAELPTIAESPQTMCGSPILAPILSAVQGFQGKAYNESATSLSAEAARSTTGLTGEGVTVGVLSDSVNQYSGGLSESYGTGDLSSSNPVDDIQDGPSGAADEGRAMLENIHDIAPGANLQFATGDDGELSFMQNIEALYNAGSKIIADDLGYGDEPMFQDGLVAQGVDYVTARGDEYFSAAGNEGPDSGYASAFRPDVTTVNNVTGNFMNFNPGSGAANPLLPVTISERGATIAFEYDQPYGSQEPAGSTAHVTSDVDFYVFNASTGAVVASGKANNIATNAPYQSVTINKTGTFNVAIVVVSGYTAPSHVEFLGENDTNGVVTVSTEYGSAGGTTYPSSLGHEASADTIGVGATPWWAPAPFIGQTPLASEPYSSSGPQLIDLSPKGTPIINQVVQNPTITAPDGGSTTVADIDFTYNTTSPPIGGEPASSYNDLPMAQQSLGGFFGTSSATPNAAAVTALMLQANPTLSRTQIIQALESTATPMDGSAAGTWNSESGYGLINAVAAINAVAPPTLASSTASLTASTVTPNVNKPFNLIAMLTTSGTLPSGTVDFYDISLNLDLGTFALAAGQAVATITPTVLGAHVYLATYSGDSKYASNAAYLVIDVVSSGGTDVVRSVGLGGGLTPGVRTSAVSIPLPGDQGGPMPLVVSLSGGQDSTSAGGSSPVDESGTGVTVLHGFDGRLLLKKKVR
jgi:hypothetical protein